MIISMEFEQRTETEKEQESTTVEEGIMFESVSLNYIVRCRSKGCVTCPVAV